jgi:hypothetical protein
MTNKDSEHLTEEDKIKIQILLEEYNTLRAELISNGNKGFQILALGGALFVLILSRPIDTRFWIAITAGLIVVSCTTFAVMRDIRKMAKRVAELEHDINQRAGEELLVWERRWGSAATGFVVHRAPLPSSCDTQQNETEER